MEDAELWASLESPGTPNMEGELFGFGDNPIATRADALSVHSSANGTQPLAKATVSPDHCGLNAITSYSRGSPENHDP